MEYKQILSEEECKGKTIEEIVEIHNNTFFIFTDKTFCIYNVNFSTSKLNIKASIGNWGLMKLGFISKSEYEQREKNDKNKFEQQKKINEINHLKELKAKYPDVV